MSFPLLRVARNQQSPRPVERNRVLEVNLAQIAGRNCAADQRRSSGIEARLDAHRIFAAGQADDRLPDRLPFGSERHFRLRRAGAVEGQRNRKALAAESLAGHAQRPQTQLRAFTALERNGAYRDAPLLDLMDSALEGPLVFEPVRNQQQTRHALGGKRRHARAKRLFEIRPGGKLWRPLRSRQARPSLPVERKHPHLVVVPCPGDASGSSHAFARSAHRGCWEKSPRAPPRPFSSRTSSGAARPAPK